MYQAKTENRFEGLNEAQLYARSPAGNSTRSDRMLAEAQCGRRKPMGVLGAVGAAGTRVPCRAICTGISKDPNAFLERMPPIEARDHGSVGLLCVRRQADHSRERGRSGPERLDGHRVLQGGGGPVGPVGRGPVKLCVSRLAAMP
ncbi:hypothetical protein [Variovorax sp. CF079]|uniref:hypothetical protein n=1 Tax=Variovorax sp. CF079 TaxID=1882774 RepID=UPI00147D15C1|nr:hypothetical protein [Variovorax sp. CF079]